MKKTNTKTKTNLLLTALWISIIFSGIFALSTILFFIYSITLSVATASALYFFLPFALSSLSAGITLILFYLSFYTIKEKLNEKIEKLEKHKKPLDWSKFALVLIAFLSLIIVLAMSGAISNENFGKNKSKFISNAFIYEKGDFLVKNGYYHETKKMPIEFLKEDIDKIIVSSTEKNVVIKYDNVSMINIMLYNQYENQLKIKKEGKNLTLSDTPSPKKNNALNNMTFFLFNQSENEKQVIVTLPKGSKIKIGGNFIFAKK